MSEAHGAPEPGLWRLRAPLRWREFDGEWVVMSTTSSSLHQLDPVCAAVLGLLEAGPSSAHSLLSALVEGAGEAAPPAGASSWSAALSQALHHLRLHDLATGGNA